MLLALPLSYFLSLGPVVYVGERYYRGEPPAWFTFALNNFYLPASALGKMLPPYWEFVMNCWAKGHDHRLEDEYREKKQSAGVR